MECVMSIGHVATSSLMGKHTSAHLGNEIICVGGDFGNEDTPDVGLWNRKQRWIATHSAEQIPQSHDNRGCHPSCNCPQTTTATRKGKNGYYQLRSSCDTTRPKSSSETDSRPETDDLSHISSITEQPVTHADIECTRRLLVQMAGSAFSSSLRHLVGIETYPMPSSLTLALQFLLDMFVQAAHIRQLHAAGEQVVPVNERLLPAVFHVDTWKSLMILLGFTLEEVGIQSRVQFCTLSMPPSVKPDALHGMVSLLKCMLVLTSDNIRTLMMIPSKEAKLLQEAIMAVQIGQNDVTKWMKLIWNSYSDFCKGLGFSKVKEGHNKCFTYNKHPESNQFLASVAVLEAFHGITDQVKETTL